MVRAHEIERWAEGQAPPTPMIASGRARNGRKPIEPIPSGLDGAGDGAGLALTSLAGGIDSDEAMGFALNRRGHACGRG